jgi:hypothetical protein
MWLQAESICYKWRHLVGMEDQIRNRAKQCYFNTISCLLTYQLEEDANLIEKERSFEKLFELRRGTKD